ncbi:MAG: hypothetical protein EXS64_09535 [Candidatus Latescibacteria bacterium]|nr:hypothetical protein [Candidatus Latescibacterota bacterium]
MNRSRVIAGGAIVLVGVLTYAAGTSHLLGSPDPLMFQKTVLYFLSAAGVVWFVGRLNHGEER